MLNKIITFIFFIALSLQAETIHNGKCVDSFYLDSSNNFNISYSDTTKSVLSYSDILNTNLNSNLGLYFFDVTNNTCQSVSNGMLGLTSYDYNFMMALSGLFSALLVAFAILLRF